MLYDDYVSTLSEPITLAEYYKRLLEDAFQDYIKFRIKLGLVHINLEKVTCPNHLVRNGDYISSLTHYHERPVLDEPIEIIHEDEDILVLNKPASIVIYPITGYRLNSLVFILAKEMGYMNLRPVHRLDKLTSGVMIFSKVIS